MVTGDWNLQLSLTNPLVSSLALGMSERELLVSSPRLGMSESILVSLPWLGMSERTFGE